MICWLSLVATLLRVCVASRNSHFDALPEATKQDISTLQTWPFREFVCLPSTEKAKLPFSWALFNRPELAEIDWKTDDIDALARQLWQLHSPDKGDYKYHRGLKESQKMMMQMQGFDEDKMDEIEEILTRLAGRRQTKYHEQKTLARGRTEEEKERRRQVIRKSVQRKKKERQLGLGWPLVRYLQVPNLKKASIEEIHEEALNHRDKYTSSGSFQKSLRDLWQKLGCNKDQVSKVSRDKRNRNFPKWNELLIESRDIVQKGNVNVSDSMDASTHEIVDELGELPLSADELHELLYSDSQSQQ